MGGLWQRRSCVLPQPDRAGFSLATCPGAFCLLDLPSVLLEGGPDLNGGGSCTKALWCLQTKSFRKEADVSPSSGGRPVQSIQERRQRVGWSWGS